jgi:hypothetical protein
MTADNELGSDDGRTLEQVRYDAMSDKVHDAADTVLELAKLVKELAHGGTTNTIIHKTEGAGSVAIVSAAVAVLCVLVVIGGFVVLRSQMSDAETRINGEITRSEARTDGKLRDLEAWRGVHATKIQNLENLQKGTGK